MLRKNIKNLKSNCERMLDLKRDRKGWKVKFGGVRGMRKIVMMRNE